MILMGLLAAVISSVLILGSTFGLLMLWLRQFPVRPDFTTNGLLWVTTKVMTFSVIAVPISSLLVFCLVIPLWITRSSRQSGETPHSPWVIGSIGIVQLILLALVYWGASPQIWLIAIAPIILVTAAASKLLIRYVLKRG